MLGKGNPPLFAPSGLTVLWGNFGIFGSLVSS